MKEIRIEDLTREELLEVFRDSGAGFHVREYHLRRAKFEVMTRKANTLANQSIAEMEHSKGPENYSAWRAAVRRFDRAMQMSDRAARILTGEPA